jgi:multidrug efflux pump subunit AcrA (membrane-fusion protein)
MSALSLAADGTSRVQVQQDDALRYVAVEPGLAADGYVEVAPKAGALRPGQLVVVGHGSNKTAESTP